MSMAVTMDGSVPAHLDSGEHGGSLVSWFERDTCPSNRGGAFHAYCCEVRMRLSCELVYPPWTAHWKETPTLPTVRTRKSFVGHSVVTRTSYVYPLHLHLHRTITFPSARQVVVELGPFSQLWLASSLLCHGSQPPSPAVGACRYGVALYNKASIVTLMHGVKGDACQDAVKQRMRATKGGGAWSHE